MESALAVPERVAVIEVQKCDRFTQVLLWRWNEEYTREDIYGWYIVNDEKDLPVKRGDRWIAKRWSAKIYRETSGPDRELEQRKVQPVSACLGGW